MKASWNQIVDYARGIAGEEATTAVASDSQALEKAEIMKLVARSLSVEVPESFKNRAKSLIPVSAPTPRLSIGKLISSPALSFGFRASEDSGQNLVFEFEDARVELRVEPTANAELVSIVGLFERAEMAAVKVKFGKKSNWCETSGEFMLEIPDDATPLIFEVVETGDLYEVNLK